MGTLGNSAEAACLNHLTGKVDWAKPTAYIALSTADPTETGAGLAEPVENNYSRKQTAGANWGTAGDPTPRTITNSQKLEFATPSGAWGDLTHWALVDTASGAYTLLLGHGELTTPKSPISGDPVFLDPGDIVIAFTPGGVGTYAAHKLLEHMVGKTDWATPPTAHVAVSTADPTDDGSGLAEPAGDEYLRVVTQASDWNTATAGAVDNAAQLNFPNAESAWGLISHAALLDNTKANGGNLLLHGAVTVQKSPTNGDPVYFPIGTLDLTLD